MKFKRKTGSIFCSILLCAIVFSGIYRAEAFEHGKVYDKSNMNEIDEFLIPSMKRFMEEGKVILTNTNKPDYEWKIGDAYLKASEKNTGKYDVDNEGILIEKASGQPVVYYYGFPFPGEINPKDPKAALKIMENNAAMRYRRTSMFDQGGLDWLGKNGKEREVILVINTFYFNQRIGGQIDNPKNFLQLDMTTFLEPFDLKGLISMSWLYNDSRPDTSFAYVPMLRRIRRVAAATNRSDPLVGSDMCTDEQNGWAGKNATMNWKFIGERKVLGVLATGRNDLVKINSDGSLERNPRKVRFGFEDPNFKGATWCFVDGVWFPRDAWIIEGEAKDPYYAYGKQIFYIDKETYTIWAKEVYDKAGNYWKTYMESSDHVETENGPNSISLTGSVGINSFMYDARADHATATGTRPYAGRPYQFNVSLDLLNPEYFTETNMRQLSK